MKIGYKIKSVRNRRGITLNTVSQETGLTTSFLSQLERDLTSPSVSSLEKIARALHVQVASFFQDIEKEELIFVKKGAGRKIEHKKKNILIETLASGFFDINTQLQLFTLGIGARLTRELIPHQGEKFMMVLEGSTKLLYNNKEFLFESGDSVYCANTQGLYEVANLGKTKAVILYISLYTNSGA
ncbi:MAG: helix-turn-helix domain-containing protein [Candidatus Omnitrophota bacterium]